MPLSLLLALWLPAVAPAPMLGCPDADGDDVCDAVDNCPTVPNPNQAIPVKLSVTPTAGTGILAQAISPDGAWVVCGSNRSAGTPIAVDLLSVPLAGGAVTQLNLPGQSLRSFKFGSAGRVVFESGGELYGVAIAGGPVVALTAATDEITSYEIPPDGSTVVFRSNMKTHGSQYFEVYSVPAGGGPITQLSHTHHVFSYAISGDGTRVLYTARMDPLGDIELYSVPIGGGPSTRLNPTLVTNGNVLEHSPRTTADGALTLYVAEQDAENEFELYSVPTTGGPVVKLSGALGPAADVVQGAFSPDGATVVAESTIEPELFAVSAAGGPLTPLDGTVTDVRSFGFSPDGEYVVFRAGSSQRVYSVQPGDAPRQISGGTFTANEHAITPDSSRVVVRRPTTGSQSGLFSTPIDGTFLDEVVINDGFITGVLSFRLVPTSGAQVVFVATEATASQGLFLASTTGGPFSFNLTPATQVVAPSSVQVDPSGTTATYRAHSGNSVYDLYRVGLDVDPDGLDRDRDGAGGACDPGDPCGDFDGDGLENCGADCDDANPNCQLDCTDTDGDAYCNPQDCAPADASRYPGAPEVNNGADDQCPGDVGFGSIDEMTDDLRFQTRTLVCWTPQSGATGYELAQAANFQFTAGCTTTDVVGNCHTVSDPPAPRLFYLVRASAPNAGSWGRTSAGVERTVSCP